MTSVYFYAEMQAKIRTTNDGSFHAQKLLCPDGLDKVVIIVEQILMIVFIQVFHIEKGIEKCLLFMNFFLSNKKAIVYLQITQIKTITAFPTSFVLADRVILSCLFLGNYCAFK
jgi:hypothetical protein